MDTGELVQLLLEGGLALGQAVPPCAPPDIPAWVRALPNEELQAADSAARQFAATLEWPRQKNAVRAQLHLRIECALDLLEAFEAQRESLPDLRRVELVSWLLVDYFRGKGCEWAQYRYGS